LYLGMLRRYSRSTLKTRRSVRARVSRMIAKAEVKKEDKHVRELSACE